MPQGLRSSFQINLKRYHLGRLTVEKQCDISAGIALQHSHIVPAVPGREQELFLFHRISGDLETFYTYFM